MRRKPVPRRPRVALALRRQPRARTALLAAIGLLSGGTVALTVHQADQARLAWGRTTPVLVATRDLAAGDALDGSNTERVEHPAALVPDGALRAAPTGRRAAQALYEGEVLREERLAPAGGSAVAARLPPGTRAVAIPLDPGTTPPVAVGDVVDVLVALAPEAAGGGPPGFVLAARVAVVHVGDAAVTVAVPFDVAPRVAVALGQGVVTLALAGG